MYKLILIIFILGLVSCASCGLANAKQQQNDTTQSTTSQLLIRFTDVSSMQGFIRIAVFNSAETWLKTSVFSKVLTLDKSSCIDSTCEWLIENTPYGDYGIAVYHDENSNGKLDKYFIGLPKEDYGFSNNESIPPKWKNAKFLVSEPSSLHTISLD
jgi:uncharacterized protein (DUF2141 family)